MNVISSATSVPVLSDAAAILIADKVADKSMSIPSLAKAGTIYATSVAYDAALKPVVNGALPAADSMAANLVAKTATFVAVERLMGMVVGGGMRRPLMSAFLVNGAGLLGSNLAQPYFGMMRRGTSGTVAAAASSRPIVASG